MCINATNQFWKTVPFNSVSADVENPVFWWFAVTSVAFAFMLCSFLYAADALQHIVTGRYSPEDHKANRFANLMIQTVLGGSTALAFLVWPFSYYYGTMLVNIDHDPLTPQDTISVFQAAVAAWIMLLYQVARWVRKEPYTNYESPLAFWFGQLLPRPAFVGFILFPAVYLFTVSGALYPNDATFGPSLTLMLISAILLVAAPIYPWTITTQNDYATSVNRPTPETKRGGHAFTDEAQAFVSTYILSNKRAQNNFQHPNVRRLTGEVDYAPFPWIWIIAYGFHIYIRDVIEYSDALKPVADTTATYGIPLFLAVYSKHPGVFMPFHIVMTFFFRTISYGLLSVKLPPCEDDPIAAQFQTAVNWNLMTTGPNYAEVLAMSSTVRFMAFFSFALSVAAAVYMTWAIRNDYPEEKRKPS